MDFIEILKENAIIGMGGSSFPTYIKYNSNINTLIVNAVECEPYRTSDYALVREHAKDIVEAIKKIMES